MSEMRSIAAAYADGTSRWLVIVGVTGMDRAVRSFVKIDIGLRDV